MEAKAKEETTKDSNTSTTQKVFGELAPPF
jgi:hypothetical protein